MYGDMGLGVGGFTFPPGKLPRFPASILGDRGVSNAFRGEGAVCIENCFSKERGDHNCLFDDIFLLMCFWIVLNTGF